MGAGFEDCLRIVGESYPGAIILYDSELRIRHLNRAAAALLGRSAEEAIGHRDEELLLPEAAATYLPTLERARREGQAQVADAAFIHEGRVVAGSIHVTPLHGPDGAVDGYLGVVEDRTEHRRLEGGLRLLLDCNNLLAQPNDVSSQLDLLARLPLGSLADACALEILEPDQSLRRCFVHRDAERQAVTEELARRFPPIPGREPGYARAVIAARAHVFNEVREERVARIASCPDHLELLRRLHPRAMLIVPLVARDRWVGTLGLFITDSARRYTDAEVSLAEAFAQRIAVALDNRRLVESTRSGRAAAEEQAVRADDLQRVTALLSRAVSLIAVARISLEEARRLAGADRAALYLVAGAQADRLELIHAIASAGDRCQARPCLRLTPHSHEGRAAQQRRPLALERPAEQGGELVPTCRAAVPEDRALVVMPLHDDGRLVGVMRLGFDQPQRYSEELLDLLGTLATAAGQALQRARLYEEAQRARAEAQEAIAAKDQFVAMVSHELRNPLAAILAAVEVLRRQGSVEGAGQRALEVVARNARLQARVVGDLLDLSRLSRGKLTLKRAQVCLGDVTRAACEALDSEAAEAGLRIAVNAQKGVWVHGDADRLQQVVQNLLSNAIKFTPRDGRITVAAERVDGRARLTVEDSGVGIDSARLRHIFGMFEQGEVGAQRQPGLGIGLALVRGIVERHGGTVAAESEGVGRGSRFIVELPLMEAELAPPPPRSSAPTAPRDAQVLLVEDNPETRVMIADTLGLMGYRVQAAASGEEALEKLGQTTPQVILADLGLPGIDGYEFLRRARSSGELEGVLAVAVTGYGQEEDVRRGRQAGFAAHFVKPVDLAALDDYIREWLGRRAPEQQAT